jgi:hypothetical protein
VTSTTTDADDVDESIGSVIRKSGEDVASLQLSSFVRMLTLLALRFRQKEAMCKLSVGQKSRTPPNRNCTDATKIHNTAGTCTKLTENRSK